jgi:hypothetical protein
MKLTSWLRRRMPGAADAELPRLVECGWCGRDFANPVL